MSVSKSEVKHTPGPWAVDNYGAGQRVVVPNKTGFNGLFRIADAHFSSTLTRCARVKEMQANARLIAAAPDMLAALKEARLSLVNEPERFKLVLSLVEAALSRAEGTR